MAGTDTTSSALEWAMAELLRNPKMMLKAQEEIRQVIGQKKAVEESDTFKLPYLQAVVKETLRLHPSAPFLIPRKSESDDVRIFDFLIPKNTQVCTRYIACYIFVALQLEIGIQIKTNKMQMTVV